MKHTSNKRQHLIERGRQFGTKDIFKQVSKEIHSIMKRCGRETIVCGYTVAANVPPLAGTQN